MFLKGYNIPALEKFDIFITKREGGYSEGIYESLNLGINSGDIQENVEKNRKFLAQVLWRNGANFLYLKQVHGNEVLIVDETTDTSNLGEADAVITNQRKYIPIILAADCVPIVVIDEKKGISGVIHSGWRGTSKNIMENTIQKMQKHFDCEPKDIVVIVGPCISSKNYEVDDTVIEHFSDEFYTKNDTGRYQLDLRNIIENQARISGCSEKNVYHIDNCTFEDSENFFSARRDGAQSGRFSMGIYAK